MHHYRNLSGNSGVTAYAIEADSILVEFRGGVVYRYSNHSAGSANIEQMKKLAASGLGLGTFISQHVKDAYAEKQ